MSLIQSEFTEYTLSHDEIMLKELERRDGIYSFIFHELETPKDVLALEKNSNKELKKHFVKTEQQQLLIVDERRVSDEAAIAKPQVQHSRNIEVDTLANVTTKSSTTTTQTPQPAILSLTSSSSTLINSKMITTATASKDCSSNISSSNSETFQKSTCEYLKTWIPPTCLSMPLSLQSSGTYEYLPCIYDHLKFRNLISTGVGFRLRAPTQRFSHIYVPMVRNRRHALKETPEYKNYNKCMDGVPDLRELFPCDTDVHAPFAEILIVDKKIIEAEQKIGQQLE